MQSIDDTRLRISIIARDISALKRQTEIHTFNTHLPLLFWKLIAIHKLTKVNDDLRCVWGVSLFTLYHLSELVDTKSGNGHCSGVCIIRSQQHWPDGAPTFYDCTEVPVHLTAIVLTTSMRSAWLIQSSLSLQKGRSTVTSIHSVQYTAQVPVLSSATVSYSTSLFVKVYSLYDRPYLLQNTFSLICLLYIQMTQYETTRSCTENKTNSEQSETYKA